MDIKDDGKLTNKTSSCSLMEQHHEHGISQRWSNNWR